MPLAQQLPSSSTAMKVLVRSKSSMASSAEWEREGLPVAPLLRGTQELPANLKLAQEAWPEQEEEDGDGESQQRVCPAFVALRVALDLFVCSVLSRDVLCLGHAWRRGRRLSLSRRHCG